MRFFALLLLAQFACTPTDELSSGEFNIEQSETYKGADTSRFFIVSLDLELDNDTLTIGEELSGRLFLEQDQLFKAIAEELKLNYKKTYSYFRIDSWNNKTPLGKIVDTLTFKVLPNEGTTPDTQTTEYFSVTVHFSNRTHSFDTSYATSTEVYWMTK